jgi:hypothetical protein
MNTIRRPRARPRVRSVNFRTLWWLLVREAYVQIMWAPAHPVDTAWPRSHMARRTTWWLRRNGEAHLREYPGRRYRP